ncbi:hypothetical protein EIP91_000443 [Steccherinum ochraceum]|uniref:Uncharacterized protein n=1 Tax=Steccherinum ochraceum TaxID=92696 RepID=A0A4R0RTJ5_9APHY|nr:hypothetical protein EIP91_000443 [Steccherinum ochraceum]
MSTTTVETVSSGPPNVQEGKPFNLNQNIPVGPASLQLRGPVYLSSYDCDIAVAIQVLPLTPAIKVGNLKGNLQDGVTTTVKIAKANGSVTLFKREDKLWVRANLLINGAIHNVEFGIMPLRKRSEEKA